MERNISTNISDYRPYPYLIPNINLDFNILKDKVDVIVMANVPEVTAN